MITLLNILCGTLYVIIILAMITVAFLLIVSSFTMLCKIIVFIQNKFSKPKMAYRVTNENGVTIIDDIR